MQLPAKFLNKFSSLQNRLRHKARKKRWELLFNDRVKMPATAFLARSAKIMLDSSASQIVFGDGLQAREHCYFRCEKNGRITVGDNVFFNNFCSLTSFGQITIGDHCQFGEGVKMYDHNHRHEKTDVLIAEQGYTIGTIEVGNNCWIGSNVTILKDVRIGDNVVIGAGCVIHKDVAAGSVVYNAQQLHFTKKQL